MSSNRSQVVIKTTHTSTRYETSGSRPRFFIQRSTMNFGRLTILKLVELILAAVILYLHYESYEANGLTHLFIITATFGGFLLIVLGTFLGLLTGHSVNRTMDMFFCVVGAVLYIASGSMSIDWFRSFTFQSSKSRMGVTKGSLAIIQGALFILDAFFVFRAE